MRLYPIAALVTAFAIGALAACGPGKPDPRAVEPEGPRLWKTSSGKKHPLAGRFFTSQGREVSESDVYEASAAATFVLLGEKHDNPDHHIEQARILGALVARQKHPALVLEMVETDMSDRLSAFSDRTDASPAVFGEAMSWEKRGWGPFENYQPIFEVAFKVRLPLVAGGIPISRAIDIAHHGEAALSQDDRKTFLLDETMDPNLESSLHEELVRAHCGHLPSTMVRGMLLAERARDAGLANALAANEKTGAVLIAGNGHTRIDRGVPWALSKIAGSASASDAGAPSWKVVSVAMEEVDDAKTQASAYEIHADYIFFTPRASDEDPCVKFMEEMKKRKNRDN